MVALPTTEVDRDAVGDVRTADVRPLLEFDDDGVVAFRRRVGARDHDVEALRAERQLEFDEDALVGQVGVLEHASHRPERVLPGVDLGLWRSIAELVEEPIGEQVGEACLGRVADELLSGALVEVHGSVRSHLSQEPAHEGLTRPGEDDPKHHSTSPLRRATLSVCHRTLVRSVPLVRQSRGRVKQAIPYYRPICRSPADQRVDVASRYVASVEDAACDFAASVTVCARRSMSSSTACFDSKADASVPLPHPRVEIAFGDARIAWSRVANR